MIPCGAHCYIFTERWADDQIHILETAHRLGVEVFEIAVGDDVHFTSSLTRRRAEELGVQLVVSPGGDWPRRYDLAAENAADRQQGLAWHQRQVRLAAELGAVAYTGALYGHPGTVRPHGPTPDEYQRMAEGLQQLAEYGKQRGVRIVIEPMSHFRTHLINTPEQAMQLLQLVEHANVMVLLDTYHLVTEIRDYRAAVMTVGERLWGLHACENDRGQPGGGLIPWQAVFGALNALDFQGYILLETYNSAISDFAFRRGMFHNVCPDAEAFVREGLHFIRQHVSSL